VKASDGSHITHHLFHRLVAILFVHLLCTLRLSKIGIRPPMKM
jgi:hypothetical protein